MDRQGLPERYCSHMRELLGKEYPDYIDSLSEQPYTALRMNTGKIPIDHWEQICPFSCTKVPWTEKGYYYDAEKDVPSKHPYYYAGLYYIQEPSAMIPAEILPVEAGDKVLDLCAAPGGKATELGAKLGQIGVLVANDISASRALALAKNIQFAGITNAVVTAETPKRLSEHFVSYFDKILVDAPCSGEGMFRRYPNMIKDWLGKGPEYYAPLQREILSYAYEMLKPGGRMVYSTCTFSVQEDEETVQWLLEQYSDLKICEVERKEGFLEGRPDLLKNGKQELKHCIRVYPHRAKGEGHFAVLLEKERKQRGGNCSDRGAGTRQKRGLDRQKEIDAQLNEWLDKLPLRQRDASRRFLIKNEKVLWEVPEAERYHSLRILYSGLPVCRIRHKIDLSPQLALTFKREDYEPVLDLSAKEDRVLRYLKGETIQADEAFRGDVLVCVDGYGLGWCRGNGNGTLKNKYYAGWRYQ